MRQTRRKRLLGIHEGVPGITALREVDVAVGANPVYWRFTCCFTGYAR
jgi:hypothetical protein